MLKVIAQFERASFDLQKIYFYGDTKSLENKKQFVWIK